MKIAFVGAGRWASALAILLVRKGHDVRLWEADAERLSRLLESRRLPDLPSDCLIPETVLVTGELDRAIQDARIIVLALPTQALRSNLPQVARLSKKEMLILSVMKGLEIGTKKRVSQIVAEFLPRNRVAILTGPGIPHDVARGDPTSLVIAAEQEAVATLVRDEFSVDNLRLYSSTDVVGAEMGGACKNVIAIAAGIADGIGLGINAKAALLTRGLYEIMRLATCVGANPMTLAGLSGMGDLVVTAFSPHSRNYQLGIAVAQGQEVAQTLAGLSGVAEGYYTCRAVLELANRFNVDLPLTHETHRILYQSVRPGESIRRLLNRTLKSEHWG
ncbi:MAG: NAD(P)H-dependent glycerol-3-phosphate dehydrogenase [candidate division WOR-3 bacterium]